MFKQHSRQCSDIAQGKKQKSLISIHKSSKYNIKIHSLSYLMTLLPLGVIGASDFLVYLKPFFPSLSLSSKPIGSTKALGLRPQSGAKAC